jgi:hypothetical protein
MRRLTHDEFIRRARNAHGPKYDYSQVILVSATEKVVIVCPQHGPFNQAPYVHYLMRSGCPACAGKRKLTIQDMQHLAQQKGGVCLSTKYMSSTSNLRWRCAKGHVWEATPYNVGKRKGTWCPQCAGVARRNLDQMIQVAKERGGVCLSKSYTSLREKLFWRCKNNHEFWMTANKVIHRSSWCPLCTKYVSERICRGFFEALFKEKFPKARPEWLTSCRGNWAELDGYCPRLRLAFERHGEQHYKKVGHFHRNERAFLERKRDDAHKLRQCRRHGIRLIVVPYTVRYEEMEAFIRTEASRRKILVPRKTRVDWKSLEGIYDPGHLERMQALARERGGDCLSGAYINNSIKLRWRCTQGHEWSATPAHISMGGWCPQCCGRNNPRSLEKMRTLARERGGECLSKVYRRNEVKLRWRCALGHIWSATPGGIITGRWCPQCGGSQPKTIRDMRHVAAMRGGKCLSPTYRNSATKLKWLCKDGHTWSAVPGSVVAGTWCPKCRDLHSGDSQRLTLKHMRMTAAAHGGQCLATEYRNNSTKLLWKCASGHEWMATPGHIRNGRWCPECKRLRSGASQRLSIKACSGPRKGLWGAVPCIGLYECFDAAGVAVCSRASVDSHLQQGATEAMVPILLTAPDSANRCEFTLSA